MVNFISKQRIPFTTMPKSLTLKEQIYNDLFSDIINGVYSADTILTEKNLMEKYHISRAPIREALQQLSKKRFITSLPRQGYKILKPDKQTMIDIERYRSVIEPTFLLRYSNNIDEQCISSLRLLCKKYIDCPDDDYITKWENNCGFHLKLFSMYGNDYAYQELKNALYIQQIYFVQTKH